LIDEDPKARPGGLATLFVRREGFSATRSAALPRSVMQLRKSGRLRRLRRRELQVCRSAGLQLALFF
jgi:hypothetical protein